MNIFYLHDDPRKAAQCMADKHLGKMVVESAQMMANAYPLDRLAEPDCPRTQKGMPRKHSYLNHPSSKWVLESISNFAWLMYHAKELSYLYTERYSKSHFCNNFINWCDLVYPQLPKLKRTPINFAFNNYKHLQDHKQPIESYRKFYVCDKLYDNAGRRMDDYHNRMKPTFWEQYRYLYKDPRNTFKFPKDSEFLV